MQFNMCRKIKGFICRFLIDIYCRLNKNNIPF
nr:MAG TPA: hypothetical protein [Caudoviricetes sp.]